MVIQVIGIYVFNTAPIITMMDHKKKVIASFGECLMESFNLLEVKRVYLMLQALID